MTTSDTILFLGLVALAYWLEEPKLQAMAGITGITAGITATALAPSPFVGLAALGIGIYLVISAVRTMRAARKLTRQMGADAEEGR